MVPIQSMVCFIQISICSGEAMLSTILMPQDQHVFFHFFGF